MRFNSPKGKFRRNVRLLSKRSSVTFNALKQRYLSTFRSAIDVQIQGAQPQQQNEESSILRQVLDRVDQPVLSLDREGHIISFNKACEVATGYSLEEVQRKKIWDFLRIDYEIAHAKASIVLSQSNQMITHWLKKNGSECCIIWSIESETTDLSRPRIFCIGRETAAKCESYVKPLEKTSADFPAAFWLIDHDLKVRGGDAGRLAALGLVSKNLEGLSLYTYLQTEDPNHPHILRYKSALSGEIVRYETQHGNHIFQSVITPLKDQQGKVLAVINISVDITERRHIEEELLHKQEELNTIFNSSPTYIWYKDRDSIILRVNRSAAQSMGLTVDQIEGQSTYKFYPKDAAQYHKDDYEVISSGKPKINIIEPYQDSLGRMRWMRTDKIPYLDKSGNIIGVIVFSLDITERKHAEEALQRLATQETAARIEAERLSRIKDEFLVTLSHELRTPLVPILGWADLLISGALDDQRSLVALRSIERNARVELQLIEDLLDTSRIITGKLSLENGIIDLMQVLSAAIETVKLAAETKGIKINFEANEVIGFQIGDTKRLQQVIWNLLGNAIKFTPQGGQIDIRVTQKNYETLISITDTGIGIKPEFLPHVFERFRQADSSITRRFGGLGLGLALVRYIVESHGGSVSVTSEGENQGTTFTISLPVTPQGGADYNGSSAAKAKSKWSSLQKDFSGVNVLVVDDLADDRDLLCWLLRQQRAEVIAVSSAREALEIIASWQPDVIISDIGMPGEDGYSFIQKVRSLDTALAKIPALALTAYASLEDKEKAINAGFQLYLSKPTELTALIKAVSSLLAPMECQLDNFGG